MATDFELLQAWRDGDRKLGNELFRRHAVAVSRFFRSKVAASAEDLTQRTFLSMVESVDQFRATGSFRAYLFAVARNQLLMHLRKAIRDRERFDPATWSVVDAGAAPVRMAARHQEQTLLLAAMQRLPVDVQIVFELFYWEDLTVAEIAEVQGEPAGTIKSRLSRGRTMLRRHLAELADSGELATGTADNLERWVRSLPSVVAKAGAAAAPPGRR